MSGRKRERERESKGVERLNVVVLSLRVRPDDCKMDSMVSCPYVLKKCSQNWSAILGKFE